MLHQDFILDGITFNIIMEKHDTTTKMKDSTLGFTMYHITDELFEAVLCGINPRAKLYRWRRSTINTSNSIMARFNSEDEVVQTFVGHIGFKIQYKLPEDMDDEFHAKQVVLKAKPPGDEAITMISNIAHGISKELSTVFDQFKNKIGFSDTDHREIEMHSIVEASIQAIQPWVYHTIVDADQKIFVYVMENFVSEGVTHLDTVDDVSVWKEQDILDVLRDVAGMHAVFYGHTADIPTNASKWLTCNNLAELSPLWKAFARHNESIWTDRWFLKIANILQMAISNIKEIDDIISSVPNTLVHNDFNVRNICLRPMPKDGKKRLVLYDWELATIAPPQRDVAEFLAFILPPGTDATQWHHYANLYLGFLKMEIIKEHGSLSEDLYPSLQSDVFMKVFDMYVVEMLLNRASMYGLAYTIHKSTFLPKLIQSAGSYLQQVRNSYPFLTEPQD